MMSTLTAQYPSSQSLTLLSRLLFAGHEDHAGNLSPKFDVLRLARAQFDDLLALAQLNHVVIRGLGIIQCAPHGRGRRWLRSACASKTR
jgi:hypothetical protein